MSNVKIELFKPVRTGEYLQAAIRVADFIRKNEVITPEGKYWKLGATEGKEPDKAEVSFIHNRSLYAGAPGIAFFLLQLYDVTGDESYLKDAVLAGDYLVASYKEEYSKNPGVHSGAAGEGLFLKTLYDKTKDERYKNHAIKIAEDIYASGTNDENGIHWEGFYDFMGDAGAVIYWLKIADITGDNKFIGYAKEVLDSILKLSVNYDNE